MKNKEIMLQNKQELINLEQEYINDKIEEMPKYIEDQKKIIVNEMIKYHDNHLKECKWDKDGNPINWKVEMNPLVISNYFLKPVSNLSCIEPIYSPEKLSLVYDYYCYIISEINDKIGYFPPSLTSFCKLSSLTLNTLRNYRYSDDYNMRVIAEKIYDQIGDENVTMSQMGVVKEKTTLFKMKAQNEMVEKAQPQIKVNVTADAVDMDRIKDRIAKYSNYVTKKGK